ncbi:hypothetical protein NUW54_g9953 [Trametes sanguinea]|uniref:Uncharacterized protein n=1 Tax=Trametes sanguinea TaxID=158606 RepID=A0ACC1P411_9APHY|nr:hypothetical protein NUW54_g9953 [Trametes sanguinea]
MSRLDFARASGVARACASLVFGDMRISSRSVSWSFYRNHPPDAPSTSTGPHPRVNPAQSEHASPDRQSMACGHDASRAFSAAAN